MSKKAILLGLALLLADPVVWADSSGATGSAAAASGGTQSSSNGSCTDLTSKDDLHSDCLLKSLGPFKFSAGPTGSGQFGSALSGKGQYTWSVMNDYQMGTGATPATPAYYFPAFPYVGYDVEGIWQTGTNQPSNASLEFQPGVDSLVYYGSYTKSASTNVVVNGNILQPDGIDTYPARLFGAGFHGDLKYRYGTFKDTSGALQKANQLLAGGSVYFVYANDWAPLFGVVANEIWPRLTETYYHPVETSGSAGLDLPAGIKADYLQSELKFGLGFGPNRPQIGTPPTYKVSLDVTYDGAQPMTGTDRAWQSLWKFQVSTTMLKQWAGNVEPTVSWISGKNGGFDYDQQVLFGILVKFIDPPTPGQEH